MPAQSELEKLLAEREAIDRALLDRHSREVALLFTDIAGSTRYFEKKGDIEGLRLVKRHNELLFPVVARHHGQVVKTIGDAIMAAFSEGADAVRCAAEMQRVLAKENRQRLAAGQEPIRIRIGAHAGRAMVSDGDVFGDTVNTAARVESKAEPEEVLLSEALFASLAPELGFLAEPAGALELKGKAAPHPVVKLDWGSGDVTPGPAPRSPVIPPKPSPPRTTSGEIVSAAAPELFVLELGHGANGLKVTAIDGSADKGTVKAYAEIALGDGELDALATGLSTYLRGQGSASYLPRVVEAGRALFDRALSDRARRHLAETSLDYLRLHLDDELVHVPWELLHDGREFVALRFAVGRIVSARADTSPSFRKPNEDTKGHALVVSNPSGDLPFAAKEGDAVEGLLREGFTGEVRHLKGPVTRDAFFRALQGCIVLHFAGHARAEGSQRGFVLADGLVSAEEVASAVGRAAPALVFANSCSSGRGWAESARGVSGLASALLLRGARHYLAPMWDVPDADALAFALRFWERALSGVPFGEAARQGRQALREASANPLSFAGYLLYGDPRSGFDAGLTKLSAPATRGASLNANRAPPFTAKRSLLPFIAGGALLAVAGGAALLVRSPASSETKSPAVVAAPLAPPTKAEKPSGPVRIAVLGFKNLSGDAALDPMKEGLAEAVVTDFGQVEGVRLIERSQVDVDISEIEFSQSKYVDPATRAQVGKIAGVELVVMGGIQQDKEKLRAVARLVRVETGEIVFSTKVEAPKSQPLELQDRLSADIAKRIRDAKETLRP